MNYITIVAISSPKRVTFIKVLLPLIISLAPFIASAQLGVAFHQSNLPFAAINYEFADRFRPELRIATDRYFGDFSAEGVFTYDILNKDDYEFYGGLGIRVDDYAEFVIPVGFNFYPFSEKRFGFHIELAALLVEDDILRGSWGIRYRFNRSTKNSVEER
jgi:hypothetical protein